MGGLRRLLIIVTTSAMVVIGGGLASAGAVSSLYLVGDFEPEGSMSTTQPLSGALPNFDPERASEPGLLLNKSELGASETDPTKYQQWKYDASGKTVSVTEFVIWAAPKDFDDAKTVSFAAYLMDCSATCTVLHSATRTISAATTWRRVNLPLTVNKLAFGSGSDLVVKITVLDSSEDDMWFAYSTATYDARLAISFTIPTTTTTTTTIPTTSTTVPTPEATTTSSPLSSTTTSVQGTTSTTSPEELEPSTTTTTLLASATTTTSAPVIAAENDSEDHTAIVVGAPLILAGDGLQTESTSWDASSDISPQEGLMVAFTTVTENISLYWPVAVGLGLVASALLWIPMRKRQSDEETPHLEN